MNTRWLLPLLVVGICGVGALYFWQSRKSINELMAEALSAYEAQDYKKALESAKTALKREPNNTQAGMLASRAAFTLQDLPGAYEYLEPIFESDDSLQAHLAGGNIQLRLRDAVKAEQHFREALKIDPKEVTALRRLAYLLTLEGRTAEAVPLRIRLMGLGHFEREHLLFAGNPRAIIDAQKELNQFRTKRPELATLDLAAGLSAWRANDKKNAEVLLREAIRKDATLLEAQARLGNLLADNLQWDAFLTWQRALPPGAETHADIWFAWGVWCERQKQPRAAVRCFWEAMKRDPNHQAACYQLAVALPKVGQEELAEPFMKRAKALQELEVSLTRIGGHSKWTAEMIRPAAELTHQLGRLWEANGWYRTMLSLDPRASKVREAIQDIQKQLRKVPPQVLDAENVARKVDLASYPMPAFGLPKSVQQAITAAKANSVTYQEIAQQAGINFTYFNSDDPTTDGRRMFEFTGGGVAVIDFDRDGWPDIYLTQGCKWPPKTAGSHQDRLFRNLGDGRFQDVTQEAGLGDRRFSQGAAIGDVNNDGFSDIYLSNVGDNRLYINNGDGTFDDIGPEAGILGERWSTSCLIADLNGDGWADLYEVNYLRGKQVFRLVCNSGGIARSCSPTEFPAQNDRFFLNQGDGTFLDQTESAGLAAANGKGLGIIAGVFDNSGRLSLFVANDMTANFHFINQGQDGKNPKFRERAAISGLAYDKNAKAQACMGIAFGDVDRDLRPDIYVTNFFEEYNTLFRQQPDFSFRDETREARLVRSSHSMLGFGTQFVDGELDGKLDIVIANGHVDDYTHANTPFQMRPQYMRNLGGQFREEIDTTGDYFRRKVLGRGLAKLDLNADGKEDFIVSHLDAPVAVLLNQTKKVGNFVVLRLEGRRCQRDAIGAQVVLKAGEETFYHQLSAGDGYFASNERQIVAGIGSATMIDELTVTWPGGKPQTFRSLASNRHYVLIQDDPRAHVWPRR